MDVEDWYQSCVDFDAPISARVVTNTERVLALLDDVRVKATFFVQGRVAETFPTLVHTLIAEGHEVQAHGYSHRPLYEMDRFGLRQELERARQTVEDAAGLPVTAFRAQDFSILGENLWALETLCEVGFEIDSSIFPVQTRRYGIRGWELAPHEIALPGGRRILEVPVAVWRHGKWRVPVAGGGYFRVLPRQVIVRAVRSVVEDGRPPVIYCHPYEFNPDELGTYRGSVPRRLRLAQGLGRTTFGVRVRALLESLRFGRFDEVLATWGLR
ncbi:MAG TPA: polysaccharide deacetylase family protein [Gaiellaceae bacterium]|nr:polysaccharide deacetylase family protein [Gaiellaceae bacterium]